MSELSQASVNALQADGPFACMSAQFTVRSAQLALTSAIAEAITQRHALIAEAGTGTGKTFAYLVPAILSGIKTVISTGTHALQDQLFHRDLPHVQRALGSTLRCHLLKGRANYLCRYRLHRQLEHISDASTQEQSALADILSWSENTVSGDISELSQINEKSSIFSNVTSTVENCTGAECPFWGNCFVVQARKKAQESDLLVVNHHLLFADLALKQDGFAEILPDAGTIIVDEAHQITELARQFFGKTVSLRQLYELFRECSACAREVAGARAAIAPMTDVLLPLLAKLRCAMEGLPERGARSELLHNSSFCAIWDTLLQKIEELEGAMEHIRASSPGCGNCHRRLVDVRATLNSWRQMDAQQHNTNDEVMCASGVYWYGCSSRGAHFNYTPLDIAPVFGAHYKKKPAAWIFTSATLSVSQKFDHLVAQLGLDNPEFCIQKSPFDWQKQALCYFPPNLPEPSANTFYASYIAAIIPVLHASNGRALLLFASHHALQKIAKMLCGSPWPLFVQGQAPRTELLARFRASGNGILLGTSSFREGIDVVGDALSVLIIDKLPFSNLDDPVMQARMDVLRAQKGQPFYQIQLPQAIISFKQALGRLIRSESDRGVVVVCDTRIVNRNYGKSFMKALPAMPHTKNIEEVKLFFHQPGPQINLEKQ